MIRCVHVYRLRGGAGVESVVAKGWHREWGAHPRRLERRKMWGCLLWQVLKDKTTANPFRNRHT